MVRRAPHGPIGQQLIGGSNGAIGTSEIAGLSDGTIRGSRNREHR